MAISLQSPDGKLSVELAYLTMTARPTRVGPSGDWLDPVGDGWYLIVRAAGRVMAHLACDEEGRTRPAETKRLRALCGEIPLAPVDPRRIVKHPPRAPWTEARKRDRDRWTIINPEALTRAA